MKGIMQYTTIDPTQITSLSWDCPQCHTVILVQKPAEAGRGLIIHRCSICQSKAGGADGINLGRDFDVFEGWAEQKIQFVLPEEGEAA